MPMQVFSCWNGAVAIKAQAFVSSASSLPPARFRTAKSDISEITDIASETFLLSVDLWKRGMGRILLVPMASVAYDLPQYQRVRQDGGRTVPHPVSIEPPSSVYKNTTVRWQSTPPPAIVYHDYAWWYKEERWGAWDEA
ncbi:hypothetical protein BU17DRAFT_63077 [Hysterangium stoloniferum]|nr:hypothetical protein BU17DRAFT_63077 [Hysterangium stoloniferum]